MKVLLLKGSWDLVAGAANKITMYWQLLLAPLGVLEKPLNPTGGPRNPQSWVALGLFLGGQSLLFCKGWGYREPLITPEALSPKP